MTKKALEKYAFYTKKSRRLRLPNSIASQMLHIMSFTFGEAPVHYEKAMVIFSIDIDVGNKKLGLINKGKNDSNVNSLYNEYFIGEIEEQALPLLAKAFNYFKVPVTFGIRGQLTEINDSFLPLILNSPVKHDIGSHGYSHRNFQSMSKKEVKEELNLVSTGLGQYGVVPRSFIFPKNVISHLDLLEEFGYECYREQGNFLKDGMFIKKRGTLYDVHPSMYITPTTNLVLLKNLLGIAVRKRLPFHLWFHPWCLGKTNEQITQRIDSFLLPFLQYAKEIQKENLLQFETMLSASRKTRKLLENTD